MHEHLFFGGAAALCVIAACGVSVSAAKPASQHIVADRVDVTVTGGHRREPLSKRARRRARGRARALRRATRLATQA